MNSITFSNYKDYKIKKDSFKNSGKDHLAIITDFDRTLSCKQYHSMMAVLSEENILTKEYTNDMNALFQKYYPIERDHTGSIQEKEEIMQRWWEETYDVWKNHKLHKQHINDIVHKTPFALRTHVDTLFSILNKNTIPSIILSASGLGNDGIHITLDKYRIAMNHILCISNTIRWDHNNNLLGPEYPIIHSANKTTLAKSHPKIANHLQHRNNIIVIGDSPHDAHMADCLPYKNETLRIGILEEDFTKNIHVFKEKFDIILNGDVDFEFITELCEEICN